MTRRFIAPAAAGLVVVSLGAAGCGKDAPPPADAREATVEHTAFRPSPPSEVTVVAEGGVTGPVSFERAESSYTARRYDEAVTLFTGYVEGEPANPWGYYMLGLSSWKVGNLGGAEQAFRRALELDATHVKSRINLSRVLLDAGRPDDALAELELALESDSTRGEIHRLIGRARDARGELDAAVDAYRRAIVLDTTDAWAMNNLGVLLIQQGSPEEALGPLARATQLRPTSPVFQNNLGTALESAGHRSAAMVAYGAALVADSTYAKARVSLERTAELDESVPDSPVDLEVVAWEFVTRIERWRNGLTEPPL